MTTLSIPAIKAATVSPMSLWKRSAVVTGLGLSMLSYFFH